eukprot:jgi/Mesvir1/19151/Mv01174-RA.1
MNSWKDVVSAFHGVKVDDQFVPPAVRVDEKGVPVGTVKSGDSIIYFDFRTDRAKPLTAAFLDVPFGGQVGGLSDEAKAKRPTDISFVTMTHYDGNFLKSPQLKEAFNPAEPLKDTYAEVAGKAGIKQLVVGESEKWRAVTWFKDGRRNLGYTQQTDDEAMRVDTHPTLPITVKVVKSRKVAAHIQAPQMRAQEITEVLREGVREGVPDIFVNYANADMVGHAMTDAAWFDGVVEAILELDRCLGTLVPEALAAGYVVMITGDHGNAEQMLHENGKANPAHTTNKVPYIILGLGDRKCSIKPEGLTIGCMAPTSLHLLGIAPPASWDRESALEGDVKPSKDAKVFKIILDGYGLRDEEYGNAMFAAAQKKGSPLHMDRWMKGEDGALAAPAEASGEPCGYPAGEAGTTEFGHVIFDAGRMVRSDVTLIDHALAVGIFDKNQAFADAFAAVKAKDGATLHVMGILSDGMVHSSLKHLEGILRLAAASGLPKEKLSLHPILDGRDVPGDSSPKFLAWLEEVIAKYSVGQINSVWGRGWGKDRDNRWKRIEAAFLSLVTGNGAVHVQLP